MAQNPTSDTDSDATAQVFDKPRGEISLTRRAVEGLIAARERIPDYSVTLGTMIAALDAAGGRRAGADRSEPGGAAVGRRVDRRVVLVQAIGGPAVLGDSLR